MLPLILAIYNRETETSNRIALLQLIEKLNFRFYGTGIATRTGSGQGELFKLAHDFYNCHSKSHVDDVLNRRILAERDPQNRNDFYHREHIWATGDYKIINDKDNRDINKRRLGNFILLRESQNIKISNNPPQEKVKEYLENLKDAPDTLMIRELDALFDISIKEIDNKRKNKTRNYWLRSLCEISRFARGKICGFCACSVAG